MVDRRGRVKLSFVPTAKIRLILQNMGYLNKRGKTTRLNLNEFLNRAVYEVVGIEDSTKNADLQEKVIQSEMEAEVRAHAKRNEEHQLRMRDLKQKLFDVQNQKKGTDYEGKNEG